MPQVICTLPNASEEISGVAFVPHELGMLSEPISDELAAHFASIRGYILVEDKKEAVAELIAIVTEQAPALSTEAVAALVTADVVALATEQFATLTADDVAAATKPAADEDDLAALAARATELGVDVKKNWGASRLKAEIGRAEAAKA